MQTLLERFFELRQCWRSKITECLQSLQLSVSATHWNNRHDSRTAFDRILHRAHSPFDRFFDSNVRRTQEHEHAKIDAILREERGCRIESREIELLVQL